MAPSTDVTADSRVARDWMPDFTLRTSRPAPTAAPAAPSFARLDAAVRMPFDAIPPILDRDLFTLLMDREARSRARMMMSIGWSAIVILGEQDGAEGVGEDAALALGAERVELRDAGDASDVHRCRLLRVAEHHDGLLGE